jgi:hypothetical protein
VPVAGALAGPVRLSFSTGAAAQSLHSQAARPDRRIQRHRVPIDDRCYLDLASGSQRRVCWHSAFEQGQGDYSFVDVVHDGAQPANRAPTGLKRVPGRGTATIAVQV